jgi:uncharacterized protein with NRDE domain
VCLLVLAWHCHPRYRLVLAGNRDEFHARPASPLGWWQEQPQVLAGRDQQAGGAWLGASRSGRLGVVTNFRDPDAAPRGAAPSRGELVPGYLVAGEPPARFLDGLAGRASDYAGFNLLLADAAGLHYYSNSTADAPRELPGGVYALSNHRLDTPWEKVERTRAAFRTLLEDGAELAPNALFELLGDRNPGAPPSRPDPRLPAGLEHALAAPFVVHERYGTRCSSVVLVGRDGRTVVAERRFDAWGAQTGASRFEFQAAA